MIAELVEALIAGGAVCVLQGCLLASTPTELAALDVLGAWLTRRMLKDYEAPWR